MDGSNNGRKNNKEKQDRIISKTRKETQLRLELSTLQTNNDSLNMTIESQKRDIKLLKEKLKNAEEEHAKATKSNQVLIMSLPGNIKSGESGESKDTLKNLRSAEELNKVLSEKLELANKYEAILSVKVKKLTKEKVGVLNRLSSANREKSDIKVELQEEERKSAMLEVKNDTLLRYLESEKAKNASLRGFNEILLQKYNDTIKRHEAAMGDIEKRHQENQDVMQDIKKSYERLEESYSDAIAKNQVAIDDINKRDKVVAQVGVREGIDEEKESQQEVTRPLLEDIKSATPLVDCVKNETGTRCNIS